MHGATNTMHRTLDTDTATIQTATYIRSPRDSGRRRRRGRVGNPCWLCPPPPLGAWEAGLSLARRRRNPIAPTNYPLRPPAPPPTPPASSSGSSPWLRPRTSSPTTILAPIPSSAAASSPPRRAGGSHLGTRPLALPEQIRARSTYTVEDRLCPAVEEGGGGGGRFVSAGFVLAPSSSHRPREKVISRVCSSLLAWCCTADLQL